MNRNYRGHREEEKSKKNTRHNTHTWGTGRKTQQRAPYDGGERHRPAKTKPRHCTVDAIERLRASETAQRRDTTVSRGTFEGTRGSETTPRHLCATNVVEEHCQADHTTTLHRRRNRKAPHNRDCTTPQHHLCRGYIRKVARGRDDATAPMCHWRSCRAPPSRDAPREHSTTTHTTVNPRLAAPPPPTSNLKPAKHHPNPQASSIEQRLRRQAAPRW